MRVLVVGLGSAGHRHLELLRERDDVEAAAVSRRGGAEFTGLAEARDWAPDAVVIANESSAHLDAARWAIEHGAHALVEKPLATSAAGVPEVVDAAGDRGLVLAVGYNLRFHPALEALRDAVRGGRIGALLSVRAEVGQRLDDWRPAGGYVEHEALGGGALLTLSHELDYVSWIAGAPHSVTGVRARVGDVVSDTDDIAEIVARHDGGVVSSVHMDLLDRAYNRRSRWIGEAATLTWEWGAAVRRLTAAEDEEVWRDDAFDLVETYRRQLDDFVRACVDGREPRSPARDSIALLEAIGAVA
jgi:hypothetical protein